MIARDLLYVSCKCPEAKEAKYKVPVKKGNISALLFLFSSIIHILTSAQFSILNQMCFIFLCSILLVLDGSGVVVCLKLNCVVPCMIKALW
jgi:hypothetical protein